MKNYEKNYEEFWKKIVENEDGTLNLDQVKRELYDYKVMMDNATTVYSELAGISKPYEDNDVVIDAVYRFRREDSHLKERK